MSLVFTAQSAQIAHQMAFDCTIFTQMLKKRFREKPQKPSTRGVYFCHTISFHAYSSVLSKDGRYLLAVKCRLRLSSFDGTIITNSRPYCSKCQFTRQSCTSRTPIQRLSRGCQDDATKTVISFSGRFLRTAPGTRRPGVRQKPPATNPLRQG